MIINYLHYLLVGKLSNSWGEKRKRNSAAWIN